MFNTICLILYMFNTICLIRYMFNTIYAHTELCGFYIKRLKRQRYQRRPKINVNCSNERKKERKKERKNRQRNKQTRSNTNVRPGGFEFA